MTRLSRTCPKPNHAVGEGLNRKDIRFKNGADPPHSKGSSTGARIGSNTLLTEPGKG